ncbi:MAG: DMT family transporter [Bacillota bacterium]|jgi:drug/metabolite transporter (DMT)-like permease|nr:DMT family transporter [Candidatus Fermentithermobacillaceae bacterium]
MPQVVADLLLLLITIIWGTTFVLVKDAIASIKPFTFLAVRFFVGSVILLLWLGLRRVLLSRRATGEAGSDRECRLKAGETRHGSNGAGAAGGVAGLPAGTCAVGSLGAAAASGGADAGARGDSRVRRELIRASVITGITLFFAYSTQTVGLLTVAAGKAAFITGLSVVLVPVGSALLLRVVPEWSTTMGVILATIGLGVMSLTLPFRVETGDVLIFLCAIGFAAHILLVGIHSKNNDPAVFAAIQLMIVAAGSLVCALLLERPLVIPGQTWGAITFTGIMATAVTVLIQSTVQKYTTASHAALIYSAEPVFAALFGWIALGEMLSPRETVGAVLILAGMLVSEITPWKRRQLAEEQTVAGEG